MRERILDLVKSQTNINAGTYEMLSMMLYSYESIIRKAERDNIRLQLEVGVCELCDYYEIEDENCKQCMKNKHEIEAFKRWLEQPLTD